MKLTILLPMSRPNNIDRMIKQVSDMIVESFDTNILVVADNVNITEDMIQKSIKKNKCEKKLYKFVSTGLNAAPEGNIPRRRQRIADVFNLARNNMPEDTDFIFVMEDDTVVNNKAFAHLYYTFQTIASVGKGTKVGFVSGLQVGRWGFRMLGAWRTNEFTKKENEKFIVETIPFNRTSIIDKIDAAGLYCFVTTREAFVNTEFKVNSFGCDVNFGFDLRRKGYKNFVDWSVEAGHLINIRVLYPNENTVVVKYESENGVEWKRVAP